MIKLLTKTLQPTSETLEAKRGEAGHRWMELDREERQLQAQLAQDRLRGQCRGAAPCGRPYIQRYTPAGRARGPQGSGTRRMQALDLEIRQAREREAPDRQLELARQHQELLSEVRGGVQAAIAALRQIPSIESEGLTLQREYGAPKAKTTPLSFFAQDALSQLEQLAGRIPPPFEEAEEKSTAEALREAEERDRKQLEDFYRYGHSGPQYEEPVESSAAMVINPRYALSRELGTEFFGADYVTEEEAKQIRAEMESTGR